jgi:hypothetical protein
MATTTAGGGSIPQNNSGGKETQSSLSRQEVVAVGNQYTEFEPVSSAKN